MQAPRNQSFYRGSDRILGGVCSGLAEGFHVEAIWVRLAFVVLAFVQGIGLVLYLALWILMPERTGRPVGQTVFESMRADMKRAWSNLQTQFGGARPATPSAPSAPADPSPQTASPQASAVGAAAPAVSASPQSASRNPSFILGAILIVIGIAFLAANLGLLDWSVMWPVALVALGIALLVRNLQRPS
jgi:phage shock protein C